MDNLRRTHNLIIIENCILKNSDIVSLKDQDYQLQLLVGELESNKNVYKFGSDLPELSLDQIVKDTGQWYGMFASADNKQKVICADYYGFSTIYYAFIKNGHSSGRLVISDSFRAVSSYLFKIGRSGSVNWEVVLPHLITNTNLFLTRASDETFHVDIKCLNYKNFFFINGSEIYILPRKNLYISKNFGYKELLLQGINKAIKNFENCVDDRPICFNLSGGKDSRVVLSMLLQSKYSKKIQCFTANPFNLEAGASKDILLKDFNLASKIISFYDLDWFNRISYEEYRLTYDEQLQIWQDFRSNSSFELKVKQNQLKNCNEFRITGIGGELVRSYLGNAYKKNFPQWWGNVQKNKLNTREALKLLFRNLCHPWLIDSDLYYSAQNYFVNSFLFDDKESVIKQIDESYLSYRNRCHAGVNNVHTFEGATLKYPLAQVEFQEASNLLQQEEQDHGKVLFDIIAETSPELNYLEFASPPWPESFFSLSQNSELKDVWQYIDAQDKTNNYKNNLISTKCNKFFDRGLSTFDIEQESFSRLARNIDIIRQNQSDLVNIGTIIERVARLQQKNINMLNAFVAKTETILDVIIPPALNMEITIIDLLTNKIQINQNTTNSNKSIEIVLQEIDLSKVEVLLEYKDKKLNVYYKNIPNDCSIACYLYISGERVQIDWYEKISMRVYESFDFNEKHIRVMSFIKRDNEPEAQRIINTELQVLY